MKLDLRPRPQQRRLLLIAGSDQHDQLVTGTERISTVGSTDLHKLLGRAVPYDRLHVTKNYFRHGRLPDLSPYDCLLNLVTDPDQNPKVLENLRKLLRGHEQRVINRPEAVLRSTRDQVAKRLQGIEGLVVPGIVRLRTAKAKLAADAIERAGLCFPLILRLAGTHSGKVLGVFDTIDALTGALVEGGEHLATEFHDFRSADGLYRKYRVYFIGGHRILRHMVVSDHWNVHARDGERFMGSRPELLAEEEALLKEPAGVFADSVHLTLEEVGKRMGLELFGMDFALDRDGHVILFEANPTMNFFPFRPGEQFEYSRRTAIPAQRAMLELVGAALPASSA